MRRRSSRSWTRPSPGSSGITWTGSISPAAAIDVLAYRDAFPTAPSDYLPGTSVRETVRPTGPPEIVSGVQDMTLPVGTRRRWMPRGYLIPAEMTDLVENLEIQNVEVTRLEEPMTAEGRAVHGHPHAPRVPRRIRHDRAGRRLHRGGPGLPGRAPTSWTWPNRLANLAFYYLEPQSRDGYVGWNVLDQTLIDLGVQERAIAYPIFKYRREVQDD
jgi:hypothetical protein